MRKAQQTDDSNQMAACSKKVFTLAESKHQNIIVGKKRQTNKRIENQTHNQAKITQHTIGFSHTKPLNNST